MEGIIGVLGAVHGFRLREATLACDGNWEGFFNDIGERYIYFLHTSTKSSYGSDFLPSGTRNDGGNFVLMVKYDNNAGCCLLLSRSEQKVYVRWNVFGWQNWKEL